MAPQLNTKHQKPGYFGGTEHYYEKYRPAYPEQLIKLIVDAFTLDKTRNVLDMGCGTGLLSLPLSQYVSSVTGIDREQGMIDVARNSASSKNINNISFECANAEELDFGTNTFDLAVFGTSFHWMKKELVLAELSRIIRPQGGIAIITAFYIWHGKEPWKEIVRKTITSYTGEDQNSVFKNLSSEQSDKELISKFGFHSLKETSFSLPFSYTLDTLLGFLFTTSYGSKSKLGNNSEQFEAELRERLTSEFDNSNFVENVDYKLLMAYK